VVVNLCVEMRNLDPDYRDVGSLLTLAASKLAEEERKRRQGRELGEQYTAALELLEKENYAEAVEALEKIADQAPDLRDVGEKLEKARAELEKARLYETALAKLADECHAEACNDLLAFLKLDPDHASARAWLLEATEGVLAQLKVARAELEKVGNENEALRARVAELEVKLKEAQAARKKLETEAKKLRDTAEQVSRNRRSQVQTHFDASVKAQVLTIRELTINPVEHVVTFNDQPIELTPTEFDLLFCLMRSAGQVLSCQELVGQVQGYKLDERDARYLIRPHITRLRQKLVTEPESPEYIHNVRGIGYLFERRTRQRD